MKLNQYFIDKYSHILKGISCFLEIHIVLKNKILLKYNNYQPMQLIFYKILNYFLKIKNLLNLLFNNI